MSQNLYARKKQPKDGKCLSDALKFVLRKRYELSLNSPDILTEADMDYLQGLRDAGIEGVGELISLIADGDEVEVWQE